MVILLAQPIMMDSVLLCICNHKHLLL